MMRIAIYLIVFFLSATACESTGQSWIAHVPDTAMLSRAFDTYRESTIVNRRFKHADMVPLITKRSGGAVFEVNQLGVSVLKSPIYELRYGTGPKKVMLWSQMHGNEPTATMALLDIFNFLEGKGDGMDTIRTLLREKTSLYFIPMLNPDGADVYTRRNAMDVDVNRDARAGETVEGRILIEAAKRVQPGYGFNLHDMNIYYNVPGTPNPVTIALLAPAYNPEREVNEVRGNAMRIAAGMNHILQGYIPNAVAKYDDTFTPRGFGDNFQSWGASTVLIESGGYKGDPEKQFIRKLNFIIILNSLIEIAKGSYLQYDIADYESLPFNDSKLSDVLLRNVGASRDSLSYKIDLAIFRDEYTVDRDYYIRSRIGDVGDLKESYGYDELDAEGYHFMAGNVHPKVFGSVDEVTPAQAMEFLREGYTAIQVNRAPENKQHGLPLVVFIQRAPTPASPNLGREANFLLARNGVPAYAVINGYLIDLAKETTQEFKNYIP